MTSFSDVNGKGKQTGYCVFDSDMIYLTIPHHRFGRMPKVSTLKKREREKRETEGKEKKREGKEEKKKEK